MFTFGVRDLWVHFEFTYGVFKNDDIQTTWKAWKHQKTHISWLPGAETSREDNGTLLPLPRDPYILLVLNNERAFTGYQRRSIVCSWRQTGSFFSSPSHKVSAKISDKIWIVQEDPHEALMCLMDDSRCGICSFEKSPSRDSCGFSFSSNVHDFCALTHQI